MLPSTTQSHKFAFLGQRWRFLKKEFENDGTEVFDRHGSIKKEIKELEKRSIDERILDMYGQNVKKLSKQTKATGRNSNPADISGDDFDMEIDDDFEEDDADEDDEFDFGLQAAGQVEMISASDARELATSLNNLRMFYQQKDLHHINKPSVQDKISDSPRGKSTSITMKANSPRPPSGSVKPSRTKPRPSNRSIVNSGTPKIIKRDQLLESENRTAKLNAFAAKTNNFIGFGGPQRTNQRAAATQSQLKSINVGKQFKTFIEEHGMRVPHFLAGVDTSGREAGDHHPS